MSLTCVRRETACVGVSLYHKVGDLLRDLSYMERLFRSLKPCNDKSQSTDRSVARYSCIQLSELRQCGVKKYPKLRNGSKRIKNWVLTIESLRF